jgi:uncharacterized protein (TIGR02246 family)
MNDIERLLAVEAIKQLKARYFRCLDTKDWDGYAAVYAEDAVLDTTSTQGGAVTRGSAAIAAHVRKHVDHVVTVHHGHTPEIEILSDTTARGIWAMEDVLRWPAREPFRTMVGYGHYHEDYVKVNGRWRIAQCRLTRLRVDYT